MIKIDEQLLTDIGLGSLPPAEKNRMLAQIYETLELRVGTTLANKMNDQQLAEFEQFIESKNEQGALTWLEGNFPNYKDVVAQELEKLKAEISTDSQKILEMVQHGAVPTQAVAGPGPQPVQQPAPTHDHDQFPQAQ